MGFPSLIYTHGWTLALWIASYMLVPVVTIGLLAKQINQVARKSGAVTVSHLPGIKGFVGAGVLQHGMAVDPGFVSKHMPAHHRLGGSNGPAGGGGHQTAEGKKGTGIH